MYIKYLSVFIIFFLPDRLLCFLSATFQIFLTYFVLLRKGIRKLNLYKKVFLHSEKNCLNYSYIKQQNTDTL